MAGGDAGAPIGGPTFHATLAAPRAFRQSSYVQDLRNTKRHLILVLLLGGALLVWQSLGRDKLTVYCAHDAVFAESILRDFEKQTGIPGAVKFDTEATKSLGLTEQIIREGAHPRCDVFWNNELLGTLDLAARGLLEPHKGTGWQRIPARFRDPDGRWTGFAARLRGLLGAGADGKGAPVFNLPYDITFAPDGALYVIEYGAGRLTKLSLDGKVLGRYGSSSTGEAQFATPWGLVADTRGRIFVADTKNRRIVALQL